MNGCDEVAVKLVKADKPSPKDMILFHKEVRHASAAWRASSNTPRTQLASSMPDEIMGKLDRSLCEKACLHKNDINPSDCAASREGNNPVADQALG